jgi:glycosyltransferase involved in cell wall biosynthesis
MSAPRTTVVFHLSETSGPFRDLELELDWIAEAEALEVIVPGPGEVADAFGPPARVTTLSYSATTAPKGPVGLARAARRLAGEARVFRAHLREGRPDLVVVATTTLPAAVAAARLERIPTLVYAAEIWPGGRSVRARGAAVAIAVQRSLASSIVACSATVARQFERGDAPVPIVYPPITDEFSAGDGPGFRTRHGIPQEGPCIVSVGNITHGRGQDVLIRALPLIRDAFPAARCAIVGSALPRAKDVAFRGRLPALAHELDVANAVTLTGFADRVADAYAAADVVVNPARVPESFGRAACEALVAESPVVATGVGAVPEVLRDGETAILVPPEDPRSLAEAVVGLLRDRAASEWLASSGRREVLERFAPERSRAAMRRVIEGVAGGS